MQKSKFRVAIGAATIAMSVCLFAGCKKNDNDGTNSAAEDTGYATDQSLSEKMYDDAQIIGDKASLTTGSSGSFKPSGCATVTRSSGIITVDFGPANCLCADDRNRRGKIIVNYTGAYADSGSVHTITFDNYYQDDNKVDGTKTVTNMGRNSSGQPYFKITVSGTITKTDGTVITTTSSRQRTWTEGYTTLLHWSDDVYQITGEGTITRPAGKVDVSIAASAPLVVALNCRWIEAGSIVYTLPGGATRTLNYGDTPNCDNKAKVVLPGGVVRDITLP